MNNLRLTPALAAAVVFGCAPLRFPDDGSCAHRGDTAECACSGAASGVRVCDETLHFGPCLCADAGVADVGAGGMDAGAGWSLTCPEAPAAAYAYVPAGSFTMGALPGELGAAASEQPAHLVELTRALWVKRTEVTQAEWTALLPSPATLFACAECPVESVSWHDALDFANAVSRACSLEPCYPDDRSLRAGARLDLDCAGFRLPTEAEWEHAARAGSRDPFYTGAPSAAAGDCDERVDAIAWYSCNALQRTHAVGERGANRWGLADVHGNVAEWVTDGAATYGDGPARDPLGPPLSSAADRVARGGDWAAPLRECRAAARALSDGHPSGRVGLRLVRLAPP